MQKTTRKSDIGKQALVGSNGTQETESGIRADVCYGYA